MLGLDQHVRTGEPVDPETANVLATSPDGVAFVRAAATGWAQAAVEVAANARSTIDDWRRRRMAHVDAGESRIIVGHVDIAGWMVR